MNEPSDEIMRMAPGYLPAATVTLAILDGDHAGAAGLLAGLTLDELAGTTTALAVQAAGYAEALFGGRRAARRRLQKAVAGLSAARTD